MTPNRKFRVGHKQTIVICVMFVSGTNMFESGTIKPLQFVTCLSRDKQNNTIYSSFESGANKQLWLIAFLSQGHKIVKTNVRLSLKTTENVVFPLVSLTVCSVTWMELFKNDDFALVLYKFAPSHGWTYSKMLIWQWFYLDVAPSHRWHYSKM